MKPKKPKKQGRGATIRCTVCGLEVTGALVHGRLMPSNRIRPPAGQPVMDGLCMRCLERQP